MNALVPAISASAGVIDRLRTLVDHGCDVARIARYMNRSPAWVEGAIARHGLDRRGVEVAAGLGALDAARCRVLWAAVLRECLIGWLAAHESALTGVPASAFEPQGRNVCAGVPSRWLGSRDFHEVAALAGIDGEAVESRLRARLAREGTATGLIAALSSKDGRGNKSPERVEQP